MTTLEDFAASVRSTAAPGSNLSGSYVRALRFLTEMLRTCVPAYSHLPPVWEIRSLDLLDELYNFVKQEERKGDKSALARANVPKSYLKHRFCTNALKAFGRFVSTSQRDAKALDTFNSQGDAQTVARSMVQLPIAKPQFYINDDVPIASRVGRETLRQVKQRLNQNLFRKMVLLNYRTRCCVTGLPVPETLRASHILGWSESEETRLLPTNGLCLSATYDAAFDRHLISFDEDYRMILSPSLHEYLCEESFCEIFKRYEGKKIQSAVRFPPSQEFLQRHRELMK